MPNTDKRGDGYKYIPASVAQFVPQHLDLVLELADNLKGSKCCCYKFINKIGLSLVL